jgi:GAF domain-containing protein
MNTTASTVRFLQDENQRISALNEALRDENVALRECLKSVRGLQQVIANLNTKEQLQPLLRRIMYEALRVVDAADGSLLLIDHEAQEFVFVLVRGALKEQLQGHRMPLDTGIAGWAAAHREPVIANEIDQDERFSSSIDRAFQFRTQSLACVPLISRGLVLGVIEVVNKFSGRPFDDRDMEMLMTLAPIAATAIDLAGIEDG